MIIMIITRRRMKIKMINENDNGNVNDAKQYRY